MKLCFATAVVFIASLDRGSAANVSENTSSMDSRPQTGWCPTLCACVLLYRVNCMNVNLGILRASMFSGDSSNIRDLWLDYNNLTRIESDVFDRMKLLKRLSLSNNYLKELDHRLFSSLFSLKYLDLRSNCLVSPLHNKLFESLRQLRILNLDYNKLTTFDSKILTPVANIIVQITLSNNPFICDCHIRDAVEWFNRYKVSSEATCAYPIAGKSWKTITFTGHCEFFPSAKVDLTCNMVPRSREDDTKSPDTFPSVILIVAGICGFFLLLCGALSLYVWRRATRNITSSPQSTVNENKDYDDIRPNNYYYYEYVPAHTSRYLPVINARGIAPELPKRPKVVRTEPNDSHQFKIYDDACNARSCESDSDSYIIPETTPSKEETSATKVPFSGRSLTVSAALEHSGDITNTSMEKHLVSGRSLKISRQHTGASDEQKGNISSLIPETMSSQSGVQRDRAEISGSGNVHTQKVEYPWSRESFWKS